MLFNTYLFIFAFLPLTLIGYYALSGLGQRVAYTWLVVASLFFYGWWNVSYLVLILTSIGINYCLGYYIAVHLQNKDRYKKYAFIFGVFFNLSLLGYFKYSGMAIDIINHLFDANLLFGAVVLPLAISFFTLSLYDPVSFINPIKCYTIYFIMDDTTKKELQSAAFERLIHHLRERTDVQNIDLMNLAGFCRNCLSKWYREEAQKKGIEISDPDARKHVYGMSYEEWKKKYRK